MSCGCHNCTKHCVRKTSECKFVQDRITTGWSIPQGISQDVYIITGLENVHVSGFIGYDSGELDFVTVRFFDGNLLVGGPLTVFEGSSVAFTSTGFNRIEVSVPSGNPDDIASGLICLTPRYQVNCETED
ncbi:S-Ena type endospore appendage [Halalkalibacter sp. APA_J-10(15)]|uniref:S-Ena type endospore appendage n=1 Tax=Halalkalibacter sp. APA_J-10(15) TaxID=2933805 RepID=UPI002795F91A|nr:S-Ena type endospore appendage [Halalkalibacter sp. APA_J-10(15)]